MTDLLRWSLEEPREQWRGEMYVIYDHPTDLPYWYIARKWVDGRPTLEKLLDGDLEFLRTRMRARGLVQVARDEQDDPVIVEVWL